MKKLCAAVLIGLLCGAWCGIAAGVAAETNKPAAAPFPYVPGKAYHILQETHSDQSGYFSLCEGLDGKIYVGTAKYGVNAYLVEFDPKTEKQRIAIDVNAVCGLTNKGMAAQAKIHTRNYVGPSGKIYVGSKQGYPAGPEDKAEYPGGYLLVYDPASQTTTNLGMPYPKQGLIDTVADEKRGLIYSVTCEEFHWMLYDMKAAKHRELGPLLVGYATTLVDAKGRASALTRDFQLAQFDPATERSTIRNIMVGDRKLTREDAAKGPIVWINTADNKTAYLIRMTDPTLFQIDLMGEGATVAAKDLGGMIEGKGFDSRGSLTVAPDGRVYALIRVNNETGFGAGNLHHLVRYDPKKKKMEDLGVLAVKNKDFFDFGPGPDGKAKPWTHGYHTLPDGTLTPLHNHMALIVAHDGTLYATIIYPFTLLKIDPIR